jgi:L-rhamnose mutarotase
MGRPDCHQQTDPEERSPAMSTSQRVCFQLQVKPDRIEEYTERHRAVWPEMLEALVEAGWRSYSLFLRRDGLLIGYFETPSLDHALQHMAETDVNDRWQAEMAGFFEDLGDARPDTGFVRLDEIFNLEDQLAAADVRLPDERLT